jgi:hypothetical protein
VCSSLYSVFNFMSPMGKRLIAHISSTTVDVLFFPSIIKGGSYLGSAKSGC